MLIKKDYSHEPQIIDDIIFGNAESRKRIDEIISGIEPLPSSGKSAILLYGVFGTGKTTLAKMLPNYIEYGKTKQELVYPEEFIGCQQGFNGPQVMTLIQSILDRTSLNVSGIHYIILDEVDNLTKLAQQSLKSALNTNRGIFVLTTNNISQLDKGLLDRCVLIEMNAAPVEDYLIFARSLLTNSSASISDSELLPTIKAANGSFRNLIHNISRLARRKEHDPKVIY
jgi:DNA polymerase III delta prime subunit